VVIVEDNGNQVDNFKVARIYLVLEVLRRLFKFKHWIAIGKCPPNSDNCEVSHSDSLTSVDSYVICRVLRRVRAIEINNSYKIRHTRDALFPPSPAKISREVINPEYIDSWSLDKFSLKLSNMDSFIQKLLDDGAVRINSFNELESMLGMKKQPRGEFRDPEVPKLLKECLKAAGTPTKWRTLLKNTLVNGHPLPQSQPPPVPCSFVDGQYLQKFDDYILWHGLTVDGEEHCYNHTVKIYSNGKVVGDINCFRLGHIPIGADYIKQYLKTWRENITKQPYWDEVDHKPVKK